MEDIVTALRSEMDGIEFVASGSCEPLSICLEAADEIDRLRAEVAALRKDAERYRWLRNHGACPLAETDPAWCDGDKLDVEIDATILWERSQQAAQQQDTVSRPRPGSSVDRAAPS